MTTIRINLLPHREEKRAQQQKTLVAMIAMAALAGLLLVLIGHFVIVGMQDRQNRRNDFLKQEIAKLDVQIKEIAQLKEKTNALLERKKVVEALQVNRAEMVHLFDELSRQLPDGMYLKSVKQTGDKLTLSGFAQSSARVSTLMRNIETSNWLSAPRLIEVQAADQDKQRVNAFILEAKQVVPTETNPSASQSPAPATAAQNKAGTP
jgi:type IV pilus assembly protein PilN